MKPASYRSVGTAAALMAASPVAGWVLTLMLAIGFAVLQPATSAAAANAAAASRSGNEVVAPSQGSTNTAASTDCSKRSTMQGVANCLVNQIAPFTRLAAMAGLGGFGIAYFVVPWFPAWASEHRGWLRGAAVVLFLMLFGPNIVNTILPSNVSWITE